MNAPAGSRPRIVDGLRLLRLAGSGGEGEVWEARDARGRQRALKLIRPDALATDAEERSRHLLRIDHPALVRVYRGGRIDDGVLAGWGFLEMDFIDGPSLHDAPADPAVLDRLWPLAEALDLLHAGAWTDGLPLVHRDVKPANLVEDLDGRLVLVDPSTLRGVDSTQFTRIGTPVFSAPEVMTGRFGPPADVYSFAVTVVALITGARGERLTNLLDHAHLLDLPEGVAHALSAVPGQRPASCRSVLEAGEELAEDPTLLLPAQPGVLVADRHDLAQPAQPAAHADAPRPAAPPPPLPRRRRLWPWTWFLVALVGAPTALAWAGWITSQQVLPLVGLVAGLHVAAHLVARRSVAAALFCPPVAWALLLGSRVDGGPKRRAWAAAVFTAATSPATVAAIWAATQGTVQARDLAYASVAATLGAVIVVTAVANLRGGAGVLLRLLLIPAWLLGAVVLVVIGLLLAPFGLARGLAWRTSSSLVEGLRGPAMMPPTATPTWR